MVTWADIRALRTRRGRYQGTSDPKSILPFTMVTWADPVRTFLGLRRVRNAQPARVPETHEKHHSPLRREASAQLQIRQRVEQTVVRRPPPQRLPQSLDRVQLRTVAGQTLQPQMRVRRQRLRDRLTRVPRPLPRRRHPASPCWSNT